MSGYNGPFLIKTFFIYLKLYKPTEIITTNRYNIVSFRIEKNSEKPIANI